MTVSPRLPNTAASDVPAVLLPYQQQWIADAAQLKVGEKSRRIGLTWAEAADDVLIAASDKSAEGQNVYYIGYNQDMALEYIEACAMWAKAFNRVAGEVEEGLWEEDTDDRHIKTYTIRFPKSGHRIVALSSRPANLRGKQGVVVIDEAAFHDKLSELLKAALALLIWGGRVRVISTHDGERNPFNELIKDIRSGKRKGSVFFCDFQTAVEQGLYRRVCLRLGKEWTAEDEKAWVEDVYDFYGDAADEELDVVPSQGSGVAIPRILIEQAMREERPVVRLALDDDFAAKPTWYRESWCEGWIKEHIDPLLEQLDPSLEHDFGQDFARVGDFSVIAPLALQLNMIRQVPFLVEMKNVPVRQQEQILWHIIDRLPRFRAGAMDATGSGATLAEYTADKYGHERIFQVMLNDAWYRDNMVSFQAAFEDQMIDIPKDADALGDIQALKKIDGIIKLPKTKTQDSKNTKFKRHGDVAIALALGWFASRQDVGPTVIHHAVPRETTAMLEGF